MGRSAFSEGWGAGRQPPPPPAGTAPPAKSSTHDSAQSSSPQQVPPRLHVHGPFPVWHRLGWADFRPQVSWPCRPPPGIPLSSHASFVWAAAASGRQASCANSPAAAPLPCCVHPVRLPASAAALPTLGGVSSVTHQATVFLFTDVPSQLAQHLAHRRRTGTICHSSVEKE